MTNRTAIPIRGRPDQCGEHYVRRKGEAKTTQKKIFKGKIKSFLKLSSHIFMEHIIAKLGGRRGQRKLGILFLVATDVGQKILARNSAK